MRTCSKHILWGWFRQTFCALMMLTMLMGCRKEQSSTNKSIPARSKEMFTEITTEVGLDFVHTSGAKGQWYIPEIMGGGVALFDYDNDGDLDIYIANGHDGLPDLRYEGIATNRLYRQGSDGEFTDVTAASGLGDQGYGMGVALGDIDNDGDTDVYVTNLGMDHFYRNNGDGTFEDITQSSGIRAPGWSGSASFLDFDRDGYLDLYVVQYVRFDSTKHCHDRVGKPDYCGPGSYRPMHDLLFRNNQDNTFTNVSKPSGIASVAAAGLGIVCEDFNEDGWIDIYIANDQYANNLWLNQQDGTFVDEAMMLGTALNLHGQAEAGMGVVAADFDRDADMDLFMTHLKQESNTFYTNLGASIGFTDVTSQNGLGWSSMPYTGFGTVAFDVELDGDMDIVIANGRVTRDDPLPSVQLKSPWNMLAEPNKFYLNDGSGKFRAVEISENTFCKTLEISRSLVAGDIDRDGDLDLLLSNIEGPARLYRNDAPRQGHWLVVRAIDPRLRRDALGARITVACGQTKLIQSIRSNEGYMSAHDPIAHFGLGKCTTIDYIDVHWPDSMKERFEASGVDQQIQLNRGHGEEL